MTESGNRPSRTMPHPPEPSEPVMTDGTETAHDRPAEPHPRPSVRRPAGGESGELQKTKQPPYKRPLLLAVAALSLLATTIVGLRYYEYMAAHEWTDNASIEAHIIPISSKVAGHVARVSVTDNQEVTQGNLLLELDPREYATRLEQARAAMRAAMAREQAARASVDLTQTTAEAGIQQTSAGVELARAALQTARAQAAVARSRLEQARAHVETAIASAAEARAQVAAAEAEAMRADADGKRSHELAKRDQIARQELDHAIATARMASARLEAARKNAAAAEAQAAEARAAQQTAAETLRQAESQVAEAQARIGEALGRLAAAQAEPHQVAVSRSQADIASAEVEQARAAVQQAELDLSLTRLAAPASGRVTRKLVEPGAYVQAGQTLMAIVSREVWVVANFMETQLADMRPGQPVEITVDAYRGKVFKGQVESFQAGTGAKFSLLPAENATGNFVKVVQRIPVKIVFAEPLDPDDRLSPGMSVVPVVQVK